MKIGIQCLAYNCAESFSEFIEPWLKLKETHDVKLWVASGQFKIYKEMGCEDKNGPTLELFKTEYKDKIDYLWIPEPDNLLSDHETRHQSIAYMKEQDIDIMIQLDADEFYTWEEVQNFIKFIEENPQFDTYNTVFRNLVGDGTQYEEWNRFSAGWIKRFGGIYKYYWDAHWCFADKGDGSGKDLEYRHPPVKNVVIPKEMVWPLHYTWTSNQNKTGPSHVKEKIEYQKKYYGGQGCGWKWDEETQSVGLNEENWEKHGWKKPEFRPLND